MQQQSHSQTWKTTGTRVDYANSTLISSLGDKLVLPRRHEFDVSRDGRFTNKAKDGLSELFIALYHKEDNEWKRASNIVQVRGRNEAKTDIWEFDSENVIASVSDTDDE